LRFVCRIRILPHCQGSSRILDGIQAGPQLADLAANIDVAVAELGIPREDRRIVASDAGARRPGKKIGLAETPERRYGQRNFCGPRQEARCDGRSRLWSNDGKRVYCLPEPAFAQRIEVHQATPLSAAAASIARLMHMNPYLIVAPFGSCWGRSRSDIFSFGSSKVRMWRAGGSGNIGATNVPQIASAGIATSCSTPPKDWLRFSWRARSAADQHQRLIMTTARILCRSRPPFPRMAQISRRQGRGHQPRSFLLAHAKIPFCAWLFSSC